VVGQWQAKAPGGASPTLVIALDPVNFLLEPFIDAALACLQIAIIKLRCLSPHFSFSWRTRSRRDRVSGNFLAFLHLLFFLFCILYKGLSGSLEVFFFSCCICGLAWFFFFFLHLGFCLVCWGCFLCVSCFFCFVVCVFFLLRGLLYVGWGGGFFFFFFFCKEPLLENQSYVPSPSLLDMNFLSLFFFKEEGSLQWTRPRADRPLKDIPLDVFFVLCCVLSCSACGWSTRMAHLASVHFIRAFSFSPPFEITLLCLPVLLQYTARCGWRGALMRLGCRCTQASSLVCPQFPPRSSDLRGFSDCRGAHPATWTGVDF